MTVEYRELPEYPGYRIGSDGSTWTRKGPGFKAGAVLDWKPLTQHPDAKGYRWVYLRAGKDRLKRMQVHRYVLLAFRGVDLARRVTRHLDGNPSNNALDNLEWGTHKENAADTIRHGKQPRGEASYKAKLTAGDVRIMRRMAARGDTRYAISKVFGVNEWTVADIVSGRSWQWLV